MTTQRQRIEAALDGHSETIRRAFLAAASRVVSEAHLSRIVAALEAGDIPRALDAIGLERAAFREFEEAIRAAYVAGGLTGAEMLAHANPLAASRVRFNPFAERPSRWLAEHSAGLITRITQEQVEAVRATLSLGMADGRSARSMAADLVGRIGPGRKRRGGIVGLSGPQTATVNWVRQALRTGDAEKLREYLALKTRDRRFDAAIIRAIGGEAFKPGQADMIGDALASRYLGYRGEVIGRTESLEAINAGQAEATRQAMEAAGLPAQKVKRIWRSVRDGKVRHSHAAMHGQTVEGDALFVSPTGAKLRYPGDRSLGAGASEVVKCRCWVQTKIELDF